MPATKALIIYEGERLNSAELAAVKTWRKLENPSQAKVARALKLTPTTISQHFAKPHVAKALQRSEDRQSDIAQGALGRILKAFDRHQRVLDRVTDAELGSDLQTLIGSMRVLADLAEKVSGMTQSGVFMSPKDADRHAKWKRKLLRWAVALGSGRKLLGYSIKG